ncbi:unnamed protein product [Polarella glacialis]|uniref:C2H2-type domain-containing protein n=1 Tax=Polarella glacialis TaxID=89957 RepID=A0A813J693_POLGL|nr:unnamed protein product [Polarella glacialis]
MEYKHLGGNIDVKAGMGKELATRQGQAMSTFRQLSKRVFKNEQLKTETRSNLAQALVVSRLTYNIAVWPQLNKSMNKKLSKAVMNIHRGIHGGWNPKNPDHNLTDGQVLSKAMAPTADELKRTARLRYFGRLHRSGPLMLWALLKQEDAYPNSWLAMAWEDVRWFKGLLQAERTLPEVHEKQEWQELIEKMPASQWNAAVRRAQEIATIKRRNYVEQQEWQRGFREQLEHAGLQVQVHGDKCEDQQEARLGYKCDKCPRMFESLQKVSVHLYKIHHVKSEARKFAAGSSCMCCLKQYHTRPRLIQHLLCRQTGCLQMMRASMQPLSEEDAEQLDKEDREVINRDKQRGQRSREHRLPFVQLHGPMIRSQL